jgi:hypothetical protein
MAMGLEAIKPCLLGWSKPTPADATDGADANVTASPFLELRNGRRPSTLRALPLLPVRAAQQRWPVHPSQRTLATVFCNALCCLAALKNSTEIAQAGRVLMPRRQLGTQTSIARPASMVFAAPARGGSHNLLSPLPAWARSLAAAELMLDSLARSGWLFCRWNKTQH